MNKIDRKKLRENILHFGKLKGLKIGQIEKAIGRKAGIISRWEYKDTRNIPIDDIYNIAILLDMTIDELIHYDVVEFKKQQELMELKKQRELIDSQIRELEGD